MRTKVIMAGAALLVALACGKSDSANSRAEAAVAATSDTEASDDSTLKPAPPPTIGADGSIAIHTPGNEMVLGLARDTVYMGLSDSLLAKTRADMAQDKSDSGGVGGAFGDMIKKTVGSALGTRVRYPISDIQGVRYENGAIQFDYRHKHAMSFESISTANRKALSAFTPDDSRRFVAAVNAALRRDDSGQ